MTALITGATGGLGQEFAKLFAKDGHDLFLIARRKDALEKIKSQLELEFNVKVTVLPLDLGLSDAPQTVFEFAAANNIKPEFLVNNAGFGDFGFFHESDLTKQENMIKLNIITLTKLCRLFIPQLIEQGHGKILNVASIASFMPSFFKADIATTLQPSSFESFSKSILSPFFFTMSIILIATKVGKPISNN